MRSTWGCIDVKIQIYKFDSLSILSKLFLLIFFTIFLLTHGALFSLFITFLMFYFLFNNQEEDCILSPRPSISCIPNSLQIGASGIELLS